VDFGVDLHFSVTQSGCLEREEVFGEGVLGAGYCLDFSLSLGTLGKMYS